MKCIILRKVLCIVVAILMFSSLVLTGCGSKDEQPAQQGTTQSETTSETTVPDTDEPEWKSDTSPFEFSVFLGGGWDQEQVWKRGQIITDLVSELTGAWLNVTVPTDPAEQLNIMIASDDLPDVLIISSTDPNMNALQKNGKLRSLTKLIDENCPSFWDNISDDVVNLTKYPDGNLYYLGIAHRSEESIMRPEVWGSAGAWVRAVRKDIYESLGFPNMITVDDYFNVFRQVKEKYPDVECIGPYPIDLSGTSHFPASQMMGAFLYGFGKGDIRVSGDYWDDNGITKLAFRSPAWYETNKLFNQFYRQGFLSKESFTDKYDQYVSKIAQGRYFFGQNDYVYQNAAIKAANDGADDKIYTVHENVLFSADGGRPVYDAGSAVTTWLGWAITTNAKQPERIIKYMQYVWSMEGNMMFNFGIEGETFKRDSNGVPYLIEPYSLNPLQYGLQKDFAWVCTTDWMIEIQYKPLNSGLRRELGADIWDPFLELHHSIKLPVTKDGYVTGLGPDVGTDEMTALTQLNIYLQQKSTEMIFAESDEEFERVYDETIARADEMGASEIEKAVNEKRKYWKGVFN